MAANDQLTNANSTYEQRQAYRDANVPVSQQANWNAAVAGGATFGGALGGAPGAPGTVGGSPSQLGQGIQNMLNAISSGSKEQFDEAVREYNQNFGLQKDQFAEAIRQFNQNYLISQANLSGYYGGMPTMAGQTNQAQLAAAQAGLTGYYQQPTSYSWNTLSNAIHQAAGASYNDSAAKNTWAAMTGQDPSHFNGAVAIQLTPDQINQIAAAGGAHPGAIAGSGQGQMTMQMQQQQYAQQMGMIAQAAALQANPFRQQQAIGQMSNLLGGGAVAGFAAPNTVAGVGTQGGNQQGGMGYLQQMIDDIRSPGANTQSMNDTLAAIPTPTKLDSTQFLNAPPSTQSMVLQGMQEKYGLDPNDALAQIKNTLPQFTAPTTLGGTVKR